MKPTIYHYPRPARNYRHAATMLGMLVVSVAISAAFAVAVYRLFEP